MALTSAEQAQLDALKKARNSGVLLVRHADTSTQFRSLDEIDRIISKLEGKKATAKPRVRYPFQQTKGL